MNTEPKKKKITLDDLADTMQRGFKEIRADIKGIHADLVAHDKKLDEISERVNENGERLSHLMTKEEVG
jgi:hypothetical protein